MGSLYLNLSCPWLAEYQIGKQTCDMVIRGQSEAVKNPGPMAANRLNPAGPPTGLSRQDPNQRIGSPSLVRRDAVRSTRLLLDSVLSLRSYPSQRHGQPRNSTSRVRSSADSRLKVSAVAINRRVEEIRATLERDLPLQYDVDMDWSVYSNQVVFVDPVTRLEGKLLYRGMIATLRILTAAAFQTGSATFDLHSIQEVEADARTTSASSPRDLGCQVSAARALRTTWTTRARSRWGSDLFINGDDIFRISKEGLIITHESAWNEEPESVLEKLKVQS